jgi:hypothetical protein
MTYQKAVLFGEINKTTAGKRPEKYFVKNVKNFKKPLAN